MFTEVHWGLREGTAVGCTGQTMLYPIVIDGRNLFEPAVMAENGFTCLSVGWPAANPVHKRGQLLSSRVFGKSAQPSRGRGQPRLPNARLTQD